MSTPHEEARGKPRLHTREEFLRRGLAAGALLGAGGVLAACGSTGNASTATKTSTTAVKLRQGGTLRIGTIGAGPAETASPWMSPSLADEARALSMYEPLTVSWDAAETFRTDLWLAEEIAPTNKAGDEWIIRLRDGVEFHNGKTLDIDDVIYTFAQAVNPKNGSFQAARTSNWDLSASKKLDSRTLRLKLTTPSGVLPQMLGSGANSGIVPAGFDLKSPVGTGPFKLTTFVKGQQSVLTRFENYWGKLALVDQVILVDLNDDTARVNALVSGQVDMIDLVPPNQFATLASNPNIVTQDAPCAQFLPMFVRLDVPPFDDVRVRQALRLAVNREQIIQDAFDGHATIGYDVAGKFDPLSDTSLVRQQDVDQAKFLLRQAGHEGLSAKFVVAETEAGQVEMCTVAVQQWKQAGMNIQLDQVDTGTLFGPNYVNWPFSVDFWNGMPYLVWLASDGGPGSTVNETHMHQPRYESLVRQAWATQDDNLRLELVHELQGIDFNYGGNVIPCFQNYLTAWSSKLGGVWPSNIEGQTVGNAHLNLVGFKA